MNCAEFDRQLRDRSGRDLGSDMADLLSHAEECATCRATCEQFRLLFECIADWRAQTPEVDLVEAVLGAYRGGLAEPAATHSAAAREFLPSLAAAPGGTPRPAPSPSLHRRWLSAAAAIAALV